MRNGSQFSSSIFFNIRKSHSVLNLIQNKNIMNKTAEKCCKYICKTNLQAP